MKRHHDKVWPDGVLKPRLDEFLSDKPAVSPRTEVSIGEVDVEVCFRALPRQIIEYAKWEGWAYVLDMIAATKVDEKYIESTQGLDAVNNENQIRLLHVSMIDPDAWEESQTVVPAFKIDHLRRVIIPAELDIIDHKRWIWQTNKTLDGLDGEQIAEIEEESKKKLPDQEVLMGYGAGGLWTCICFMAAELDILRMSKLPDGSGGDEPSSDPSLDESQADNSLQSLYTRLSASLDEKVTTATEPLNREIRELRSQLEQRGV